MRALFVVFVAVVGFVGVAPVWADEGRPGRWPVSLDEVTGADFGAVGLTPLGAPGLVDGVVTLRKSGDGVAAAVGNLERFVVEMDLAKPGVDQAFAIRFANASGADVFWIKLLPGGKLDINGTAWTPRDFSSEARARFLFSVDQAKKRIAVLIQYAESKKGEKFADESEFVSYHSESAISRVELLAQGDGEIVIRELNIFRPDIVTLGDSTCQGGNQYSPIPTLTKAGRSWTTQYQLEKMVEPPLRFTNLGFAGHKLSAMMRHVERAEKLGAKYAVVIIGVNSVTAKNLSDEQIQDQYRHWVQSAREKGIEVYACTMYPKSYGKDAEAQGQYDRLLKWIRETVPTLGAHVIELHDGMVGPDGVTTPRELTSDGHHPNDAGYKKGATIIRPYLDPVIKQINEADAL